MIDIPTTYTCPRCYSPRCRSEWLDRNAQALASYPDGDALAYEAAVRATEEAKACDARRAKIVGEVQQ